MGFGRCLGNHTIVKGTGQGISRPYKGVLSRGGDYRKLRNIVRILQSTEQVNLVVIQVKSSAPPPSPPADDMYNDRFLS